jgi:hypothetical protein
MTNDFFRQMDSAATSKKTRELYYTAIEAAFRPKRKLLEKVFCSLRYAVFLL